MYFVSEAQPYRWTIRLPFYNGTLLRPEERIHVAAMVASRAHYVPIVMEHGDGTVGWRPTASETLGTVEHMFVDGGGRLMAYGYLFPGLRDTQMIFDDLLSGARRWGVSLATEFAESTPGSLDVTAIRIVHLGMTPNPAWGTYITRYSNDPVAIRRIIREEYLPQPGARFPASTVEWLAMTELSDRKSYTPNGGLGGIMDPSKTSFVVASFTSLAAPSSSDRSHTRTAMSDATTTTPSAPATSPAPAAAPAAAAAAEAAPTAATTTTAAAAPAPAAAALPAGITPPASVTEVISPYIEKYKTIEGDPVARAAYAPTLMSQLESECQKRNIGWLAMSQFPEAMTMMNEVTKTRATLEREMKQLADHGIVPASDCNSLVDQCMNPTFGGSLLVRAVLASASDRLTKERASIQTEIEAKKEKEMEERLKQLEEKYKAGGTAQATEQQNGGGGGGGGVKRALDADALRAPIADSQQQRVVRTHQQQQQMTSVSATLASASGSAVGQSFGLDAIGSKLLSSIVSTTPLFEQGKPVHFNVANERVIPTGQDMAGAREFVLPLVTSLH